VIKIDSGETKNTKAKTSLFEYFELEIQANDGEKEKEKEKQKESEIVEIEGKIDSVLNEEILNVVIL
jgi:5-deoxy-D-glucuronate isomerase